MSFAIDYAVYENGKKSPQYTIDSDLQGEVSLQEFLKFMKLSLLTISTEVLKEEQARGFDKEPLVIVDGRANKPLVDVKPLGKIEFTSRANLDVILLDAYDGIITRSPERTGLYLDSNYVFVNTNRVATNYGELAEWLKNNQLKTKDLISFVNIQPYARKLERAGVTKGKEGTGNTTSARKVKSRDKRVNGAKVAAPNGAYYLTSRALLRKYKRNVNIKFKFVSGSSLGLTAVFKTAHVTPGFRKSRNRNPSAYLYPTIQISVTEKGTL